MEKGIIIVGGDHLVGKSALSETVKIAVESGFATQEDKRSLTEIIEKDFAMAKHPVVQDLDFRDGKSFRRERWAKERKLKKRK
jgi:hypothetical protein